jgi:4-amino-4-deoxy-L-arabinose transferase-like glycosyltransferase
MRAEQTVDAPLVSRDATSNARVAWLFWTAIAAIAVLPILFSLRFLGEPLGRDQAVYFTIVRSGDLPYVSAFDHKPPVIYGWYALADLLGGTANSTEFVNFLAALQLSASALLVAWIGLLVGERKLAVLAGLLMAFFALNRYLQFDANTEVFMLPPLLACVGFSIVGVQRKQSKWFLLAGALGGLAAMTKTVGLLSVFAITSVLVWAALVQQLEWRQALRWSTTLIAGAASLLALTVLPFVVAGAFNEFWHANVTYNLSYNSQVPFFLKVFRFSEVDGRVIAASLPIWVLAFVGAILSCRTLPSIPLVIVMASAVAALLGVITTGQQFPHYFVALTPFAALFAAFALIEITRGAASSLRQRRHVELLLLVLAAPAALALLPILLLPVDDVYKVSHPGPDGQRAVHDETIARDAAARTDPSETFYVVGREPQLYVLSGRQPSSYYFWGGAFDTEPETFDETFATLEANPPRLLIDTAIIAEDEVDGAGFYGFYDELDDDQRARLNAFLDKYYEFDRQIEHAKIYVRR